MSTLKKRKRALEAELEALAPEGESLSGLARVIIAVASSDELDELERRLPADTRAKLLALRTTTERAAALIDEGRKAFEE